MIHNIYKLIIKGRSRDFGSTLFLTVYILGRTGWHRRNFEVKHFTGRHFSTTTFRGGRGGGGGGVCVGGCGGICFSILIYKFVYSL